MPDHLRIAVYPRLLPLRPANLPRKDIFGTPGASNLVPDPVYVKGVRDYRHDRPARHIHWKASARFGRLQEKILESSEQEKVLIVINVDRFFSTAGGSSDFERMLEAAASLAVRLDEQRCPVGLAANGVLSGGGTGLFPVAGGSGHLADILEAFARMCMTPAGNLTGMLRTGFNTLRGASCVYFSYDEKDGAVAVEKLLATAQNPLDAHPVPGRYPGRPSCPRKKELPSDTRYRDAGFGHRARSERK